MATVSKITTSDVDSVATPETIAGVSAARRHATRVLGVVAFAVLTTLAAKVAVPLPGTAVPFTLGILAVLLSGVVLGPGLGATSQLLYLGAGLAGLPVFAAGGGFAYLLGPTGGYLLAYPVAAAIAGAFSWGSGRVGALILGAVLGLAMIHLGGASWLSLVGGVDFAWRTGVVPFLPGDVLKVALVVLIGRGLGTRSRRIFG